MEEQQEPAEHQPKQRLCEECSLKAFKYKCPACSRRTCCLPCVNSHKHRLGCTGKRDSTQFIPLSQFDDSTLLSDYNLLEDVKRVAESAQRLRVKLGGYPQFRLPFHLKTLRSAAARKGTKLLFLPAGMFKREKNQTRYNQRKRSIYWTIEWRFQSTDVVLLEHGVHESITLRSAIEKHLQPGPWKGNLRRFYEEGLDNLKFFIRKHQKGSKAPCRELDLDAPLNQLFAGLVFLEYPVIHVYLRSDSYDFEVVKDVTPPQVQQENKIPKTDANSSPGGIVFKEEEIIEDERSAEPLVIDLLKSSEKPIANGVHTNEEQTSDSLDIQSGKNLQSNNSEEHTPRNDDTLPITIDKEMQMLDAELNDFDFDQDLIDAYSFLMEQSNPDDFLDYKPEGEEDTNMNFPQVEELEEGEIPNSD